MSNQTLIFCQAKEIAFEDQFDINRFLFNRETKVCIN